MNRPTNSQQSPFGNPVFVCLLLTLATLAVYFPVKDYRFLDYDDTGYFFANPHVLGGLTWPDIQWAFTSGEGANWHPLTWLSLMLDAQLFGAGAAAPHVVNVLFHIVNSILLFLLLRRWTNAFWRSATVAMLFAVHPLHVESVAWISERKDVLSAFFGLLALLCYTRYASQRTGFRPAPYFLALLFFACGLMSKPMLVTLPFVMLLLDFWPLQRFGVSRLSGLVIEKTPFILLSVAMSVVTYIVQQKGGAVQTMTKFPLILRVENAFVAYARYLWKIFFPFNLASPYPFPGSWPAWLVVFSVVLFVALCLTAVVVRKRYPFILTGWFWFAGMLVPVIGLVQVGGQSMADRYAYLPMIGILIIFIWGAGEICIQWQVPWRAMIPIAAMLVLACAVRARNQVGVWRDDGTLFSHALAVTKNNYVASVNLGYWFAKNGQFRDALDLYHQALQMAPDDPTALYDVGNALARPGHWDEAIADYRRALQITPDQPDVLDNLGFALAQSKQLPEATACFQMALKLRPDFADVHNNLATVYFMQGNFEPAVKEFSTAIQLDPDQGRFSANLAGTYERLGQTNLAVKYYQQASRDLCDEALPMAPDDLIALYDAGNALAHLGYWDEAIADYRRALQITPDQPDVLDNLGFALAQNNQLPEATTCFQMALKLRPDFADAHNNLATVYLIQGNLGEAVKEFSAAMQLAPNEVRFSANLAGTYERLGQTNLAVKYYRQAAQLEPGNHAFQAKLRSLEAQNSNP